MQTITTFSSNQDNHNLQIIKNCAVCYVWYDVGPDKRPLRQRLQVNQMIGDYSNSFKLLFAIENHFHILLCRNSLAVDSVLVLMIFGSVLALPDPRPKSTLDLWNCPQQKPEFLREKSGGRRMAAVDLCVNFHGMTLDKLLNCKLL